jgi:hypothetical protein
MGLSVGWLLRYGTLTPTIVANRGIKSFHYGPSLCLDIPLRPGINEDVLAPARIADDDHFF